MSGCSCCFPVSLEKSRKGSFNQSRSYSSGSPKASPKGSSKALLVDENRVDQEKKQLVVCFGEMLIDFVPTVSGVSLAEAPAFKKAPGGAPANVAVGIARLGGFAAFIGKTTIRQGYGLLDKSSRLH
uniref:Carbohydrate kinase PfkB domain-containing protein n=1 Tax=Fagus sylvatica TaxID=28930 RepID=A0A2N9GU93_FAGSY